MTDLQKIIIACILTAMASFTITIAAGWMAIIRSHVETCSSVESIERQQRIRWERISDLDHRVSQLEAKWDYLEGR